MENILIVVGSLRKGSINMQLARAVAEVGKTEANFTFADISHIPLYNGDEEASMPESVKSLKATIRAASGILVITPEYNRSIPGVLKNAIDWTSRPYGDSAWDSKPVAMMGATGGLVGTANAQAHLRDTLLYLNTHVMGQPEVYLGMFATHFNEAGELIDPKTREILQKFIQKFKQHIAIFKP